MVYDLMNKGSHEVGRKNMKAVHVYNYGANFFSVLMPSINLFWSFAAKYLDHKQ